MEPPPSETSETHDEVWNLDTVCFKVEGRLFTVFKKEFLTPGSVFLDMFQCPSGSLPAEGKDASNPIILPDAKAAHFSAFLSVLYPWVRGSVKLKQQTADTQLGVLRLANMWRFPAVRDHAISLLSTPYVARKAPMEKIRLGEEYFVQTWVIDGYVGIIQMEGLQFGALEMEPYNFSQALVIKILYLKVAHGPGPRRYDPWGGSLSDRYQEDANVLRAVVEERLGDEIARAVYVTGDKDT